MSNSCNRTSPTATEGFDLRKNLKIFPGLLGLEAPKRRAVFGLD